jgi:hypothetical protein
VDGGGELVQQVLVLARPFGVVLRLLALFELVDGLSTSSSRRESSIAALFCSCSVRST